jgi:hypothetical protein
MILPSADYFYQRQQESNVKKHQMKNFQIKKHIPDNLDRDCDIIFDVLNNWVSQETIEDKIGLLEQCIEYLNMEKITQNIT